MEEECATCHELGAQTPCAICGCSVCETCAQPGEWINISEWWTDRSNVCTECRRVGCGQCITACMECANDHDEPDELCDKCAHAAGLRVGDCEAHPHMVCEKCATKPCCECKALENYRRYGD